MILKCKSVTKAFGNIRAIDDLSFTVGKGEVFGIAGPNGSGKTTLFNLITGVYPFSGNIFLRKEDISGLKPYSICHKGIARTFQIPQLSLSLSVYDNIRAGAHFGTHSNSRKEKETIHEMIDFLSLENKAGVNDTKYKLFVFAISAFLTGMISAVYAHYVGVLSPRILGLDLFLILMVILVLGGIGNFPGALIGAFITVFLSEWLRPLETYRNVVFGGLLVALVIFMPQGITGVLYSIKKNEFVRRIKRLGMNISS
ncbi:MAG: ATP-binding cassette domain-containing protein [Desulfobacterales bacterium]|nr:ATP-binding cassette domain-containing protein [Desulfobacterales bacterium]